MFEKIKVWYRELPDKKKYIEFVTALLSVPVLLSVLLINLSNLNNKKEATPTPTPKEKVIIVTSSVSPTSSTSPFLTPTPTTIIECKKEVGPVKINRPAEGELVTTDKVCIDIGYKTGEYCSVVWSYRMDDSDWSSFTDKEICVQNLSVGPKELEVRIKSKESDDEVTLIRNFYYKSKEAPTQTPSVSPTL